MVRSSLSLQTPAPDRVKGWLPLDAAIITCFLYLDDFLGKGVRGDFGLEACLSLCHRVLHPVEVLTCIAAWRIICCGPGIGFDARSYEKHLDDGDYCLLQHEALGNSDTCEKFESAWLNVIFALCRMRATTLLL